MKVGRDEIAYIIVLMVLSWVVFLLSMTMVGSCREITFDMLPIPTTEQLLAASIDPESKESHLYTFKPDGALDLVNAPDPLDNSYQVIEKILCLYLAIEETDHFDETSYFEISEDVTDEEYEQLQAIIFKEKISADQLRNSIVLEDSGVVFAIEDLEKDDPQLKILDKDNLVTSEE